MENKKLNIAFLSFYSGNVYRGVETFVHELANNLTLKGHTVTVLQGGPKIEGAKYITKRIEVETKWSNNNRSPYFLNYWSLLVKSFTTKALKEVPEETDIVVVTNGQWQTLLTKIWSLKNKKKIVVAGQSGPGLDDRLNIMCFPDSFVAISQSGYKKAKSDNPFVRRDMIPNGVDLNKFKAEGKKITTKLKKPLILCVGAFVPQKRIDLVIKAVSLIPDASLLIVGKGPLENKLKEMAESLMPGRFEIKNALHSEMPDVYRSCNLFTLVPTETEAFGIVFVEALASNLPVVTIDDETRKNIIGDAGLLIDKPENAEKYKEALKKALTTNWGRKPRSQSEKYGWKEITAKYEKLFFELINK